jgi:hypothetical protein
MSAPARDTASGRSAPLRVTARSLKLDPVDLVGELRARRERPSNCRASDQGY